MLLHTNVARLFSLTHPTSSKPMLCRRWQPTRAASGNGKQSQQQQQQQQDDADDPVAAMLWAAQQQDGLRVVFEGGEGAEELDDLEDILEDLEDPWMRNPSPPEWSEAPLFGVVPDMPSSSNSNSSSSDGAAAPGTAPASDPGSRFATVSWQQLQQRMLEEQKQQRLVVLEVKCPDDPQQQQQQQPCRPLPDPLPWPQSAGEYVQRVTVDSLARLTRELATEWQQEGAVVAVWDSGHHSCLAAAIRLSAVYRLPHVVLLQQDSQ